MIDGTICGHRAITLPAIILKTDRRIHRASRTTAAEGGDGGSDHSALYRQLTAMNKL